MSSDRYCFVKDNDAHTYLILVDLVDAFYDWVERGDSDDYHGARFDDKLIGCSMTRFSFTDPQVMD